MNKYVKVIDTNGKIVDALDTLHFVKWNSRAKMVDNCKDTDPNRMGLLSYDVSTIWHIEGTPEFPAEREYITTNYVEIDKDEFEAIRKAIDDGIADLIENGYLEVVSAEEELYRFSEQKVPKIED